MLRIIPDDVTIAHGIRPVPPGGLPFASRNPFTDSPVSYPELATGSASVTFVSLAWGTVLREERPRVVRASNVRAMAEHALILRGPRFMTMDGRHHASPCYQKHICISGKEPPSAPRGQ